VIAFVIGAVVLSVFVLRGKYGWWAYLLGLLSWTMVSSMVTMLSVIACALFFPGYPCPMMYVLSYPVSIHVYVIFYWCPNCVAYQLQIWLGGLLCWEGVSPMLIESVEKAVWLIGAIFPWLLVVTLLGAFLVFAVVWSVRPVVAWFKAVWVLYVI